MRNNSFDGTRKTINVPLTQEELLALIECVICHRLKATEPDDLEARQDIDLEAYLQYQLDTLTQGKFAV